MIRSWWTKQWAVSKTGWVFAVSVDLNIWGLGFELFIDRDKFANAWDFDLTGRIGPVGLGLSRVDSIPF
jgi:hypothetical protein